MFSSTIKLLLYRYLLKVHPQVACVDLPPEYLEQNNTFSSFCGSQCLLVQMGVEDKQIFLFCSLFLLEMSGIYQFILSGVFCCISLLHPSATVRSSPVTCRFFFVGLPKRSLVPSKITVFAKSCWELWKSVVLIQNKCDEDILFQASKWILSTLLSLEDSTILSTHQSWFSRLQRCEIHVVVELSLHLERKCLPWWLYAVLRLF